MADVTRLVRALRAYEVDLERHESTVAACRDQLERSLARLGEVYEGLAARELQQHWARTTQHLETYEEGVRGIRGILVERLATLEAVDRPDGL